MAPTEKQFELLRDKYVLWDRASREGPMELRDYNRRAAEALKALLCAVHEPLGDAREAFLAMIADAIRWEEDVDGDTDGEGRTVITVHYHLTTRHHQLDELVDALGIKRAFSQSAYDAICEALSEPVSAKLAPRP
jgi:hypothetical protein